MRPKIRFTRPRNCALTTLVLFAVACQSVAPEPPEEEQAVEYAVDAYRAYERGDCSSVQTQASSAQVENWNANELRHSFRLLKAFCQELDGDIEGARDTYRSLLRDAPLSFAAQDAGDRLILLRQAESDPEYTAWVAAAKQRAATGSTTREALDRVPAEFPPLAQRAGVGGYAVVEFGVTPRGDTDAPVVVESQPPLIFDGVAVRAVREWRYQRDHADAKSRRQAIRLVFKPESETNPDTPESEADDAPSSTSQGLDQIN